MSRRDGRITQGRVVLLVAVPAVVIAFALAKPWLTEYVAPDRREEVSNAPTPVRIVTLEPPSRDSSSRLPLSQLLPDDFVLVFGLLKNPHKVDGEPRVEFAVDRVLRGEMQEGKFITKDELPIFHCVGPVVASQTFQLGKPLACWLVRTDDDEWSVIEMQMLTPSYKKLLEAGVSDDPAGALRPLIVPHGLDYYSIEVVKIFALRDELQSLMIELIRDTPPLLEACQGAKPYDAKWDKRVQLLSGRLAPALEIIGEATQYSDPSQIDLLLPCYEALKGDDVKAQRLYLHYHLSAICRMAQFQPDKVQLSEKQLVACRELFLTDAKGFGETWSHTGSTACTALANIADAACITALLEEQARRPISRGHWTIATALAHAAVEGKLSQAEADRIQQAWLETIPSLQGDNVIADGPLAEMHASQFASTVAGGLYRHGLQPKELEAVLAVRAATDRKWLKEALVRYLPEP